MKSILLYVIILISAGILFYSTFSLFPFIKEVSKNNFWQASLPEMKNLFQANIGTTIKNIINQPPEADDRQNQEYNNQEYNNNNPEENYEQNNPIQQPKVLVETYIISGPKDGEIIEEANTVTFKFKGIIYLGSASEQISFETKVLNFDTTWQTTDSNERTIDFPAGPKEYKFLVRAKINDVADTTPAMVTFKINTSPYFSKLRISDVQKNQDSPSLVTLSSYIDAGDFIDITGWYVQSKREMGKFVISQAVKIYRPEYQLISSANLPLQDIFVTQGEIIYLSSALNPLGMNANFKLNKCFGYLTNYHNFSIGFSKICPVPGTDEIVNLDACCQQYVTERGSCETPQYWDNIRISSDQSCVSFINDYFSYAGCFRRYYDDEDFLQKEWHIYMARDPLSYGCDILYLRDKNGLFVDKYLYGSSQCQ